MKEIIKELLLRKKEKLTVEEYDVRLRFFAGKMLVLVFSAAMAVILYNLVWVEQPMNGMAPADKAFFEILKMMVAFLSGVITTLVAKTPSFSPQQPLGCPPAIRQGFGAATPFQTSFQASTTPWQPSNIVPAAPYLDDDDERSRHAEARHLHKDW